MCAAKQTFLLEKKMAESLQKVLRPLKAEVMHALSRVYLKVHVHNIHVVGEQKYSFCGILIQHGKYGNF